MNFDKVIQYWTESAEEDWLVVEHLFDSGDYRHALFFGNLFLEKLLKALVVQARREHAPRTHNLLFLAERAGLALTEEQHNTLLRVTAYNIETRYQMTSGRRGNATIENTPNERLR